METSKEVLVAIVVLVAWCAAPLAARAPRHRTPVTVPRVATITRSATVPLHIEDNRVYVDLDVVLAAGKTRKARFWVNTGGGTGMMLAQRLARQAGLTVTGKKLRGPLPDVTLQQIPLPHLSLGGIPLDLSGCHAVAVLGSAQVMPGIAAEGFLPPCVLEKYQVVFNYPRRQFTLALPGTLHPVGQPVTMAIDRQTGLARIQLTIEGHTYGFLLDTGATFTMASRALVDQWESAHPHWKHLTGAVGPANMIGDALEDRAQLIRVPQIEWGPFSLCEVGVVSRPIGVFEKQMTAMMAGPVMGALEGNALREFRIEIDYPTETIYLKKASDTVGIILRVDADGDWYLSGVARYHGKPVVNGVKAGDRLLRIGGFPVKGASLAQVIAHLAGRPGEQRGLTLERGGKTITLHTEVHGLP